MFSVYAYLLELYNSSIIIIGYHYIICFNKIKTNTNHQRYEVFNIARTRIICAFFIRKDSLLSYKWRIIYDSKNHERSVKSI